MAFYALKELGQFSGSNLTKRKVLSIFSSFYDPLGLTAPVLCAGKLFIRTLWSENIGWDSILSNEQVQCWQSIESDLFRLTEISFPRKVANSEARNSLIVFCDASPEAYGFVAYAVKPPCSELVYAKVRASPLRPKKKLPTLELLAIFLFMKCLDTILSVTKLSFNYLYVFSDSQVALSWVLTRKVKSKNIFSANRVKEISALQDSVFDKYKLKCEFRYVITSDNPADLLTRGLKFDLFLKKLDFWCHGPTFILQPLKEWPKYDCFSLPRDHFVQNLCLLGEKCHDILPVEKFSNLDKLVNVCSYVLKFFALLRKVNFEWLSLRAQSRQILIKLEQ